MCILFIRGIKKFTLSNIIFNATRSQNVLNCSSSSLYVRGYFGVSHNTGGVAITAESKVIFSKAVVLFSSNNIQGNKRHDSIVSVDFKSTLSFIKSHVTFKSNHGNLCGGLTANNEALISEHSTANFINNYGMSGGALSLYSASLLKISSYNVTMLFARNKAQRGGAIFLDDSLYEHDYWKRNPGSL